MKIDKRYPKRSEVQVMRAVELASTATPPTVTWGLHDFGVNYDEGDTLDGADETYLFTLTDERTGLPVMVRFGGVEMVASDLPMTVTSVTQYAELFYVGPEYRCVCRATLYFKKPEWEDAMEETWTVIFY